jgi:hypothetical protein
MHSSSNITDITELPGGRSSSSPLLLGTKSSAVSSSAGRSLAISTMDGRWRLLDVAPQGIVIPAPSFMDVLGGLLEHWDTGVS